MPVSLVVDSLKLRTIFYISVNYRILFCVYFYTSCVMKCRTYSGIGEITFDGSGYNEGFIGYLVVKSVICEAEHIRVHT